MDVFSNDEHMLNTHSYLSLLNNPVRIAYAWLELGSDAIKRWEEGCFSERKQVVIADSFHIYHDSIII